MTTEPPLVEYDLAARRSSPLAELVDLIRYRDLVQMMVANIIKTRYKRSALGVVWTLLNPLLNMAVLTLAFSSLFSASLVHYPVYVLRRADLLELFYADHDLCHEHAGMGRGLFKRVYIPRTIFAVSSVGNGLVNLGLSMIPLVLIMLVFGHPLYATWWMVPVAVLLLAMFALGVSLFMSTLAVFFTDVVDIYQIFIQAAFFITPIMYPEDILPANLMWLLNLNPMYHLLEVFRAPIYLGAIPGNHTLAAAVFSAVAALVIGWWAFTRKADEFAYRI